MRTTPPPQYDLLVLEPVRDATADVLAVLRDDETIAVSDGWLPSPSAWGAAVIEAAEPDLYVTSWFEFTEESPRLRRGLTACLDDRPHRPRTEVGEDNHAPT